MPELSPHPRVASTTGTSFGKAMLEAQSLSNSHDYLSNCYSSDLFFRNIAMAEPNLHGLVESEVFVGEEPSFLIDEHNYATGLIPSSLSISYHKDGYLQPLNAVKEDVEAEAAEEQLSGNFHSLDYLGLSLGPSSLSSSIISSNSLEDAMNAGGDSYSSIGRNQVVSSSSIVNKSLKGICDPKLTLKCIRQANYRDDLSPGINAKSSPRHIRSSPPHSARNYDARIDHPISEKNGYRSTPQKFIKTEKCKTPADKKAPIWHNPSKCDKLFGSSKKENGNQFRREGSYRAKSEARELPNRDSKFSSLPRTRNEQSEKDYISDSCGIAGHCKKTLRHLDSEVGGSIRLNRTINHNSHTAKDLPQESKNILDKYATLPRKKAKEISARWKDQIKDSTEENNLNFIRSKSVGKGDSIRSMRISPPAPTSVQSPRFSNNSTKQVNKSTKSKSNSPSARLLARQLSSGKDKAEKPSSPNNLSNVKLAKLSKSSKMNAEVQVNIKWDPNEHEMEDKLRSMSEELSTIQIQLKRAEVTADEVEQLRMEAVELRRVADMEKMDKEELQEELDRTSGKVKDMLTSMEGVEKEFNNRGESLIELDSQLHNSTTINIKMQEKLNQYEDYSIKLRKDLDKSVAAQKILLQQVQDLEAEGREISEFMSEEKNALAECLKEAEMEITRQRKELEHISRKLELKYEETRHMVRLAEERRQGYIYLQTEMQSMKSNTQDMMVCQGAELSGTSVELANLTNRMQIIIGKIIQDYTITENDIENVVTPHDSDSSLCSSTNGTPQKSPSRVSQNRSPHRPGSFMQSFLNAISTAQRTTKAMASLKTKVCEADPRKSPDGSEDQSTVCNPDSLPMPSSLFDQVTEVDHLISRFLKVCCVLKSDADNILTELEDENERLCGQIELQQQMIEQQYADVDSLKAFESNARKELKVITKDLEAANETLNKVCDEDTKIKVKKLEDNLVEMSRTFQLLERLHEERLGQLTHVRHHFNSSPKVSRRYPTRHPHRIFMSPPTDGHKNHNGSLNDDDLEYKQPEIDYVVSHVLKTLETIPDVVSSCPALRNLYLQLNTSEHDHKCLLEVEEDESTLSVLKVNGSSDVQSPLVLNGNCENSSSLSNNNFPNGEIKNVTVIVNLTKEVSQLSLNEAHSPKNLATTGDSLSTSCASLVGCKEVAVDCNANPEIIVSNGSVEITDPKMLIPLLTHETSL